MSLTKKIGILISILLVLFIGYIVVFFVSSTDTENVRLEGCVYDIKTKEPINNAKIFIVNNRYEDNDGNTNWDEYLGTDKFVMLTDENGFYKIEIEKSAFVFIEVFKEGYSTKTESKYSSKRMKFETYLERTSY